jgi:hypothetical protein
MKEEEFEALCEEFRRMPGSPYIGFGWKPGTDKIKVRLKSGLWIDGTVSENSASIIVSIDDGAEVVVPKTIIRPS